MLRLFQNTATGTTYAVGETVLAGVTGAQRAHMTSAGYAVTTVTADQLNTILRLHGWDPANLPGATTLDKVTSITLNVQGASEDFITGQLQQVLNSFGSQTNTINANVVIMRDQVKAHVSNEADRIIASV
jgi:hypothetical protein